MEKAKIIIIKSRERHYLAEKKKERKTPDSQQSLEKNQVGSIILPDLKLYYKVIKQYGILVWKY